MIISPSRSEEFHAHLTYHIRIFYFFPHLMANVQFPIVCRLLKFQRNNSTSISICSPVNEKKKNVTTSNKKKTTPSLTYRHCHTNHVPPLSRFDTAYSPTLQLAYCTVSATLFRSTCTVPYRCASGSRFSSEKLCTIPN